MNGDDKAKTPNTPKVEISVRNFGPIAEADLDLRPLTVFVGPSNTGKTYLSVLIYALHRIFDGFLEFLPLYNLEQLAANWYYKRPVDTTQKVIDKLNIGQSLAFSDLPQEVRELALKNLRLGPISENIEDELKRCFDLDVVSRLIRSSCDQNDAITVSLIVSDKNQDLWSSKLGISKSSTTMNGAINENIVIVPENWLSPTRRIGVEDLVQLLNEHRRIQGKPYYLPAARSSIMQSHQVIASSLVARSTRAGLETSEIPTLSGVIADLMQQIILYRERGTPNNEMDRIAKALESDVLAGQIITKPSPTGYPEFLYHSQEIDEEIRLTRSSSMVSELAPLVLFIRGLVRSGDTLIIEEPEAHLHPAAQTQMAATLARLVRAGVRVIVTTHSDFMLKEIANLMHEGELEEKGALKKQAGKPERWLLPEEVGVWLFQKNGIVDEIEFDRIHGIEPIEYEDVVEALYNRWAGLQNRIEELKDESELECE